VSLRKPAFYCLLIGLLVFVCSSAQGQLLYINEFMALNTTIDDDKGEADDWVEIYNGGDTPVDLGGMYFSDDPNNLTKCLIPAGDPNNTTIAPKGFLVFWFDGQPSQGTRHVNTKLDGGGDSICLTASDGTTIIDSLTFGQQTANVSRGRKPDGSTSWYSFTQATPGTANTTTGTLGPIDPPAFSHTGGFCTGTVTLTLTSSLPTARICYTLDGSEPTDGASETSYTHMYQEIRNGATKAGTGPTVTRTYRTYVYSSPITISSTKVVRARVFDTGRTPSPIVTHSYIFGNTSTLPILSLSTTPANLWNHTASSTTGGIFVMGPPPYGAESDWYPGANLWEDWERPLHVEMFEPNGTLAFGQDMGVKLSGGTTRLTPQKPCAIFARSSYGAGSIPCRVFPDLDIDSFEALVLRCAGDDWVNTMFQDAMITGLVKDLDIDIQAYRPAAAYINGSYYGIYEIRERLNEHYLASHHGADPDNVDILENNMSAVAGDNVNYSQMMSFIKAVDLTQTTNYAEVKKRMEINNYIDYLATEIYAANTDWPAGNTQYWRPRVANGRWRWMLHDTDYGFAAPFQNSISAEIFSHDTLSYACDPNSTFWGNKPWSTELFRELLESPTFRNEFIRRFADLLNITFRSDRVVSQINAKKSAIEPEMPAHIARWKDDATPWSEMRDGQYWMRPIQDKTHWDNQVQRLVDFANARPGYVRSHIASKFGLSGTATLTFNITPADAGQIKVNRMILPFTSGSWSGVYFKNISLQLAAMPARGYKFQGWTGVSGSSVTSLTPSASGTITATFVEDAANENPIVINEINYNSKSNFNPGNWVELYNPNNFTVDLTGWQFRGKDAGEVFTFPNHTTIGPGDYLVLCEDKIAFHSLFPTVENYLGNMNFNLSNGGQAVSLYDAAGTPNLIDTVTYDDASPWPTGPDGNGPTLELKNAKLDNASAANWSASTSHGTPGSINSAHCYSLTTSVTGSHGTLTPSSDYYVSGLVVDLTATPDSGYRVKKWTGADNDLLTTNANTVTMSSDRTVTVEFEAIPPVQYQLSTSVPGGHGTLSPLSGKKDSGDVVTLTAVPDTGYKVKKWTGTDDDTSISTTNTVTMTADKIVTVEYEVGITQYQLTTSVTGGHGVISPASQKYDSGTIVAVKATPDSGYRVKAWSGTANDTSAATTNSVVMNADKTVTVSFESITIPQWQLTTQVTAGEGSLIPASRAYNVGTVVSLTAIPDTGFRLKKWTGTNNDASFSNTNTVTISSDKTVSVEFEAIPIQQYQLTMSVVGGHGTLIPASGKFNVGTLLTLTATPDPGYCVKRWTGTNDDASVSTTNKVLVRADSSVSVEFAPESVSPTPTPTPDSSGTPTPTATVTPTDGVTATPTDGDDNGPGGGGNVIVAPTGMCGSSGLLVILATILFAGLITATLLHQRGTK